MTVGILLSGHDLEHAMSTRSTPPFLFDRRSLLKGALACASVHGSAARPSAVCGRSPELDATFIFTSDIHACRMGSGLSPHCAAEGKTDENLRRHIAAINRLPEMRWPREIDGAPAGLASAGSSDRQADGRGDRRRHDRRRRRAGRASRRRHAAPAVQPPLPGGSRDPTASISPSMSASATTISTRTARRRRSTGTGASSATMSSSTTGRA